MCVKFEDEKSVTSNLEMMTHCLCYSACACVIPVLFDTKLNPTIAVPTTCSNLSPVFSRMFTVGGQAAVFRPDHTEVTDSADSAALYVTVSVRPQHAASLHRECSAALVLRRGTILATMWYLLYESSMMVTWALRRRNSAIMQGCGFDIISATLTPTLRMEKSTPTPTPTPTHISLFFTCRRAVF